jgi:hypothetical protein
VDVDRTTVVRALAVRPFLVAAARHHGRTLELADGLAALEELAGEVRAAEYAPASSSPTLPQRPGHGWVSVMEAARRLGLTPRAVRYRLGAGTLRGARDRRGRWFVDPSTLEN